jgi:hypothetical protein
MDNIKTSQIIKAFFVTSGIDANLHKCNLCNMSKKQNMRNGYSNLMFHLTAEHPDYGEIYLARQSGGPMDLYIRATKKATWLHSWIHLIVAQNLPFSYVDSPLVKKFSNLRSISVPTLHKYMGLIREKCQQKISKLLPPTFGLMFDGWSHRSEHFIAIFAIFTAHDGAVAEILLGCGVLDDVDENTTFVEGVSAEDQKFGLTAADIFDYITTVLDEYGINVTKETFKDVVEYIAADNCSTNQSLATLLKVPLVGCYSHRLNLAVQHFIGPEFRKNKHGKIVSEESVHRSLVNKVDRLMGELNTQKNSALLRPRTPLTPQRKNATRWSSTFTMLLRWTELRGPIGEVTGFPEEVTDLIPSASEHQSILALIEDLKKFESVSKHLQAGGADRLNLGSARSLFQALYDEFETRGPLTHLRPTDRIVHSPIFESAISKIQGGQEGDLSTLEADAVKIFLKPDVGSDTIQETDSSMSFAQKYLIREALLKRRRTSSQKYRSTEHVSPTSNSCERLFSAARLIMSYLRSGMDCDSCGMLLFLKVNLRLWEDPKILDEIMSEQKQLSATNGVIDVDAADEDGFDDDN